MARAGEEDEGVCGNKGVHEVSNNSVGVGVSFHA